MDHSHTGGIGFAGLLTIVFITLKLTGYITWSWIWVLAPLWIGIAFIVLLTLTAIGIALIANKGAEK